MNICRTNRSHSAPKTLPLSKSFPDSQDPTDAFRSSPDTFTLSAAPAAFAATATALGAFGGEVGAIAGGVGGLATGGVLMLGSAPDQDYERVAIPALTGVAGATLALGGLLVGNKFGTAGRVAAVGLAAGLGAAFGSGA